MARSGKAGVVNYFKEDNMNKKTKALLIAALILLVALPFGCKRTAQEEEGEIAIAFFRAEPAEIEAGGVAMLSWEVSGTMTAEIDQGIGQVPAAGEIDVRPTQTTTYTLSAGIRRATATIAVKDAPIPGHATIARFAADDDFVSVYQKVEVSWLVLEAKSVTLDGKPVGAEGSFRRTYDRTTEHELEAIGEDGKAVGKSLTIRVDLRSACEWLSKPPDWEFLDKQTCRIETQPNGSQFYAGRDLVYRVTIRDHVSGDVIDQATGRIDYVGPGKTGSVTIKFAVGKIAWEDKAEVDLLSIDCSLIAP